MARALVFPGQGSQQVGQGRALAEAFATARRVFEEVDEALSFKLSRVMWEGPEETLTLTENAQPALMAVSLAVARTLEKDFNMPVSGAKFVAGHSLGEYSALAAAGALGLADAARLLLLRGQAMQDAVPVGEGAMAALLGLDFETAKAVAEEAGCEAANDNAPGQVVISGGKAAVARAVEIAKTRGAKRAMTLPVSAPFHCALMAPAAEVMADELNRTTIMTPVPPVVANVGARPIWEPKDIRESLVAQVTGTVRWRESVAFMAEEGATAFYELGVGKVLTGLIKRIAPDAKALPGGTPAELEALARDVS